MDWSIIVPIALGILTAVFAVQWGKAKQVIKEVADLITVLSNALKDDKISPEELVQLRKEFLDVVTVIKDILKLKG